MRLSLVATEKRDGDIFLIFIGEDAPLGCSLYDVANYSKELQSYLEDLLSKILSGVYDVNLMMKDIE